MSRDHWDAVWSGRDPNELSWFQAEPTLSMALIREVTDPADGVIDVGGGASRLVDGLLDAGYRDLTVLDIAPAALDAARQRLGSRASAVTWIAGDVLGFDLRRRFDLWHDRAVLHFLVDDDDRAAYVQVLRQALRPGGHVVLATFAPTGPHQCSGLPVRRSSAEDMAHLLGEGFTLLDRRSERHETPAGAAQDFAYGLFARAA